MVEGVEVGGRPEAGVEVSRGHRRRHPLVIGEERQQGLPARLGVVSVGPVRVHELDGLT